MYEQLLFIDPLTNRLFLSNKAMINKIECLVNSYMTLNCNFKMYKKALEKMERKERKRIHNKKKSDRMKRLRVKKEKKRA